MDRISIDLDDDMTIGDLRRVADSMGRRLYITFQEGPPSRPMRPGPRPMATSPAMDGERPSRRGGRRPMSPEVRAALARNLEKARAARSAKVKPKKKTAARA